MSMVGFPLLLIPLAIYNIFVFLMGGVEFSAPIVTLTLLSRAPWTLTFGDALLALSMILLWFEIVKASRPGARFLTDHLLSLIVFAVAAAEFLLLGKFTTSTFFLLTVLTAVEFLAGVSIGIRHRNFAKYVASNTDARHESAIETENRDSARDEERTHTLPQPPSPARVEPKLSESKFSDLKPPEMMTISPAHDAAKEAPKPVPTLAVNHVSEGTPAPTRKVTGWTVADLMRDDEPPASQPPKT